MKITLLACTLVFLSTLVRGQTDADAIHLEITEPISGETYRTGVALNGFLTAPVGLEYEIRVRCSQVTHWLLCSPRQRYAPKPDANGRGKHRLDDPYLLPLEGDQVMEVDVFELRNGTPVDPENPITSARIPFRFISATREELMPELTDTSQRVCGDQADAARRSPNRSKYGDFGKDWSSTYIQSRSFAFLERTNGYAWAGRILDRAGHSGDALRALRIAEQIFEREAYVPISVPGWNQWPVIWQDTYVTTQPGFLDGYSEFYARRGDLERAVYWKQEAANFYQNQRSNHPTLKPNRREKCLETVAYTYEEIAKLHYLLARDRAEWDAWIQKSDRTYNFKRK